MAKDPFGIRITVAEKNKAAIRLLDAFIDFVEDNFEGLNIQKARKGGNPKYQPGGQNYDPENGEFLICYSRLNIKNKKPIIPTIKKEKK